MKCTVGGTDFHYEAVGEGRPIVLLHGWMLDHRVMMDLAEPAFAERSGWRRIYPDLPGMGQTSGHGIDNQDQVLELLVGFIEATTGGSHYVVGGFSYGGYLALGTAYTYRERLDGLLVIAPAGLPGDGREPRLAPMMTLVEDPSLFDGLDEQTAEAFRTGAVVQTRELLDSVVNHGVPANRMADVAYLTRLDENWPFSFATECLREPFAGPTLVLTGRQDARVGWADAFDLMDNYPRGTYAVLDSAGHALAWDQRPLFNALVGEWLDRVERYAPATS
jgi:pimeloyl-ACP methyl ester carboxylesterase